MKKRRKAVIWLAVLTVAVLGIGGTAAYLTSFDRKENVAAAGSNTTGIEEEFPDPSPTPVENNPEFTKKVWVSNTSPGEEGFNVECYVRLSLGYSDHDIGKAVVLRNLDQTNWVFREDGYYYYRYPLKEGESTPPLFTGFYIDSSRIDKTYLNHISEFRIQIYEESVQSAGFSDYLSAWRYYQNQI